ncbi:MAG: hypothetical protein C3F13_13945 [Anaerolineales bacterium]|nr:MAG: hypothetical protein C3F13_13945 [Anaerolineales bacterium]
MMSGDRDIFEPTLTRCGYRCDLCLAYRRNVEIHPFNQQLLSDGWYQYFGFRIEPEKIICDGCMANGPILIDRTCPVRPCVIARGIENCSACANFACEKLQERIVEYDEVYTRIGGKIPDDDYLNFIQPYENRRRLEHYLKTGEVIR